jgi:hypothetical protein
VSEEPFDQQSEFVGGPFPKGLQPPALQERRPVEDAEDDIRITDVDR